MKFRFIAKKLEINANIGIFDTLFNTISFTNINLFTFIEFSQFWGIPTISIVQNWLRSQGFYGM